jgi:hypothetical protein
VVQASERARARHCAAQRCARLRLTRVPPPCRSWVDGRFVHVLTPNIYRTLAEALQTFDYITKTGNFGFVDREVARWSGVAIMVRRWRCLAAQRCACSLSALRSDASRSRAQYTLSHMKLKKRHNITDERQALYEEARNHRFLSVCTRAWRRR